MLSPSSELALTQAYLANVQMALANQHYQHAALLLQHALTQIHTDPRGSSDQPTQTMLSFATGLDCGKKRAGKPNEDYLFALSGLLPTTGERYGLFVVADGMGGHTNGQEASRLAVHALVDTLLPSLSHAPEPGMAQARLWLEAGVQQANCAVYEQNRKRKDLRGQMGTTITAALVIGSSVTLANVGDSRTYLFRPNAGLMQVTRDHSTVARLVDDGLIGPDDIYTHPRRNEIYRHLGEHEEVEVDISQETLFDKDVLLLCSDGLWEMTRPAHIEAILQNAALSPAQMAQRLVLLALQGGGLDNIAAVVTQVSITDISTLATMLLPPSQQPDTLQAS